MFKQISIIGDGAMGTVLARLLAGKGFDIRLWGHDARQLQAMARARENTLFLPGYPLPEGIGFEARDDAIFDAADLVVSAVPCQFVRPVWQRLQKAMPAHIPIVSVAKGIEIKSLLRPTEVITEITTGRNPTAVLSGPTIADELVRDLPATALVASEQESLAERIQVTFNTEIFRVYTNTDKVGVEIPGACKNVIAIAAGVIDGIGAGDNAKAALLSRGLAEIARLGVACGARAETFSGLAGLGDLVTTCISPSGRNRSFGERIGRGQSTEEALSATVSVVEGVATCRSLVALARQKDVEMPITQAVYQVLFQGVPVQQAIAQLMSRELKAE